MYRTTDLHELLNVRILWFVHGVTACLPLPPDPSVQDEYIRPPLPQGLGQGEFQILLVIGVLPESDSHPLEHLIMHEHPSSCRTDS